MTHELSCDTLFVSKFAQIMATMGDDTDPRLLRAFVAALEIMFQHAQRTSAQEAAKFVTISSLVEGIEALSAICAKKNLTILLDYANDLLKQMKPYQQAK